jgi:hypothetical protein
MGPSSPAQTKMTLKEFRELELAIRGERFESSSETLTYGVERAIFEQQKLKKLIAAAEQVDAKTVRTKLASWQRQLQKAIQSQARFEKMREEMRQGKIPAAQKAPVSA